MFRLFAFMMLLFMASCTKHKPVEYKTPQFEFFEKSGLANFKPFALYTAAGEVSNPGLVGQYATEFSQFFYSETTPFSDTRFRTFSVVSEDSMINTSTVPAGELKRTAGGAYDKFSTRWLAIANDTNALNLHIVQYKTHKAVTTPSGYTYYDVEDPVYILKRVGNELRFPIIRYILISRGDNQFSFAADKINNVFSPLGVNKLGPKDTLLVQAFDLVMKKLP
jgi:hypothetical protein